MKDLIYTPYGFRDYLFEDSQQRMEVRGRIHAVFERYGYRDIQTPVVEYLEVFDKERGSISPLDMYKFVDRDGEMLALRPDMTPALARLASLYFQDEDLPCRVTATGSTFRYNSRYSAKQRELSQTGIEFFGDESFYSDAEVLAVAIEALKATGLTDFKIAVGHARITATVLELLRGTDQEREELVSCLHSKNFAAMEQKVEEMALSRPLRELMEILADSGDIQLIHRGRVLCETEGEAELASYFTRLEEVHQLLSAYGLDAYLVYDLSMTADLGYYTGIVFKGYAYGSGDYIVDGGRYDDLLKQFQKDWPAVGFGIYQDSLMTALKKQEVVLPRPNFLLAACDRAGAAQMIPWIQRWRERGIRILFKPCVKTLDHVASYGRNHQCSRGLFFKDGLLIGMDLDTEREMEFESFAAAQDFVSAMGEGETR